MSMIARHNMYVQVCCGAIHPSGKVESRVAGMPCSNRRKQRPIWEWVSNALSFARLVVMVYDLIDKHR